MCIDAMAAGSEMSKVKPFSGNSETMQWERWDNAMGTVRQCAGDSETMYWEQWDHADGTVRQSLTVPNVGNDETNLI